MEPGDVEAPNPAEALVDGDVGDLDRFAPLRCDAGDALAERQADLAHLAGIEPVGRGEGQAQAFAVRQIERADLDLERLGRPVDDRPHELVPVAGLGRELGDLVQERQLAQPPAGRSGGRFRGYFGGHGAIIAAASLFRQPDRTVCGERPLVHSGLRRRLCVVCDDDRAGIGLRGLPRASRRPQPRDCPGEPLLVDRTRLGLNREDCLA